MLNENVRQSSVCGNFVSHPKEAFVEHTTKNYSRFMPYVAATIGAGAAAYLLYRWFSTTSPYVAAHIEAKLPVAKNLKTVPDTVGNYDIDGVSFDTEGVIISGARLS